MTKLIKIYSIKYETTKGVINFSLPNHPENINNMMNSIKSVPLMLKEDINKLLLKPHAQSTQCRYKQDFENIDEPINYIQKLNLEVLYSYEYFYNLSKGCELLDLCSYNENHSNVLFNKVNEYLTKADNLMPNSKAVNKLISKDFNINKSIKYFNKAIKFHNKNHDKHKEDNLNIAELRDAISVKKGVKNNDM